MEHDEYINSMVKRIACLSELHMHLNNADGVRSVSVLPSAYGVAYDEIIVDDYIRYIIMRVFCDGIEQEIQRAQKRLREFNLYIQESDRRMGIK